ncbi:MAG: trans aux protein [Pseudomonadota bacterium]|nr:trans aux protein [Pseudomonadota bacterium]
MRFLMNLFVPCVVVLTLTGCGFSAGNIPADHFYRLPVATPVNHARLVEIKSVRAEGIYNERALLFVEQARPLEVNRYNYHFWVQTPAALVQTYMQGCLNNSNAAITPAASQPAVQIHSVIHAFERVIDKGQTQAVVKLQINHRIYESTIVADSMDMHATVAAYGKAMQQVCEAVARDL